MGKDRKRKKSRVKSKAAVVTQAQQAKSTGPRERRLSGPPQAGAPASDASSVPEEVANFHKRGGGGGLLSGMRGGFKTAVGVDRPVKQKKGGWLDILLWIAVAVAAMYFLYKKMG